MNKEMIANIKEKIKPMENELILGAIIILVALTGFGLGRLSKIREGKIPITVENMGATAVGAQEGLGASSSSIAGVGNNDKTLVASKNGTKYHYTWCPGAATIKEENKVFFASKEEAERAGYKPASNCKGL